MAKLEIVALTDPGRVRNNNEDNVSTSPELGLVVLADGMGGHLAGEVASGLAVDLITQHVRESLSSPTVKQPLDGHSLETSSVAEAVRLANAAIHEASQTQPECAGMGSTVVTVLFHGTKLSIGHVGDSRLYRLRGNELTQITLDHSVVQELLNRGLISKEEAYTSTNKNLVTRALGIEANVEVDVQELDVKENDLYLLCSDGLNDVFKDEVIREMLLKQTGSLEDTAKYMVDEVNANGGPDNVSIILIRTDGEFRRTAQ
ncbi:MAG: Stp1/IreP family PP2C-type Ser/Thr phosphatase [Gammaproteobacteria bacterium]|nr:Stp1/IreP family PP2C-type Ser/Thr phosphatase [Gammaproteobacteria bacterium]